MATGEPEALDFEPEDDDLMDEDNGPASAEQQSPRAAQPRLKSAITGVTRKTKGRGFRQDGRGGDRSRDPQMEFESLESDVKIGPARSIEGWIVLVTGVHEEAQEDDLQNTFGEYGEIKNLHLNLDRRSGFVKGYALIEYEHKEEAERAIAEANGTELLTQTIYVDWAFSKGPMEKKNFKRRAPREHRSRSPSRRY